MNLFEHASRERIDKEQPLAARMRPRTLDEFVGQEHILAPGRLLRRAIQADQLSSLIFYGPPGTGKTTLAAVIANTTQSHFQTLNAVLAGVGDIRTVTEAAQQRRIEHNRRTILFVDEVHRWNKAQQDALLPWVENGTVILIGATTENPYFSVNRALVSRSRIFQLKPLQEDELQNVARAALKDPERGYGKLKVDFSEDALRHITAVANGDARAVLNALELAVETTQADADEVIHIDLAVAEESIQQRAVLYDKEGDYHFDTISAFIKSLRGSDPDAAVYWLAKMVYAGEDPRFLFRRMLIFCGEDIGLADPNALVVTEAAAAAFERVGMPEGRYHLGMAALYLATAPKSNSVFAFFDALAAVEKEREGEVPNHLKDASRDQEGFGHGRGYLYPHAYRDHWVAQQYLPNSLQGKLFYQPGQLGYEHKIAEQVRQRREAQLAAALENPEAAAPPEILSFSPANKTFDRWLSRTIGGVSERLSEIRDALFAKGNWHRNDLVLDLRADQGLFLWEAVRRTPEGGVWGRVTSEEGRHLVELQAAQCPELRQPEIVNCALADIARAVADREPELTFDRILGRNAIGDCPDKPRVLQQLRALLASSGQLLLAEAVLTQAQRLHKLLPPGKLPTPLLAKVAECEERLYHNAADPRLNWTIEDFVAYLRDAGFNVATAHSLQQTVQQRISTELVDKWFPKAGEKESMSYADSLAGVLNADELAAVEAAFRTTLTGQMVDWHTVTAIFTATA